MNLPCENCVYTCILVGCKTNILFIYSKLDRVIPFLRGFGSHGGSGFVLASVPGIGGQRMKRILSGIEQRRRSALLLSGFPPLPPFAARTHFPLSIYADIAGNLRGEVETSSRLEEALHMSSLDHSFSSRQWPVKSNELLV